MHRFIASYSSTKEGREEIEARLETLDRLKIFYQALESRHFTLYTAKNENLVDGGDLKVCDEYAFLGEAYDENSPKKIIDHVLGGKKPLGQTLKLLDGKYIFFKTEEEVLTVFRDPLGLKPVYFSRIGQSIVFSSEKKLLWGLKAAEASSLPPNRVCKIDPRMSMSSYVCIDFSIHPKVEDSLKEAVVKILEMMTGRMDRLLDGVEEVAVAFSGGVDSTLTAILASAVGKKVVPIVVGLEGSKDFDRAESSVEMLGLELERVEKKTSQIEGDILEATSLVEEANMMKIGVALPLLWASRKAFELGIPVILTGQGSDELYGGYPRFLGILRESGEKAVEKAIFTSVVGAYEVNYERDEKVASSQGLSLKLPLISPEIVYYALRLPLRYKISSTYDEHRKLLIRKVAEKLGIPKEVAWRKKRSLQYSTLTYKAVRNIARMKGLKPNEYLERLFKDLFDHKQIHSAASPRHTIPRHTIVEGAFENT